MLYEYERQVEEVVRFVEDVFEIPDGERFRKDHNPLERSLALALDQAWGRRVNGDILHLFKLLEGTQNPLNVLALRELDVLDEARVRADADGTLDDVEQIVAFLMEHKAMAEDFKQLAESWLEGASELKQLIVDSPRTEED